MCFLKHVLFICSKKIVITSFFMTAWNFYRKVFRKTIKASRNIYDNRRQAKSGNVAKEPCSIANYLRKNLLHLDSSTISSPPENLNITFYILFFFDFTQNDKFWGLFFYTLCVFFLGCFLYILYFAVLFTQHLWRQICNFYAVKCILL